MKTIAHLLWRALVIALLSFIAFALNDLAGGYPFDRIIQAASIGPAKKIPPEEPAPRQSGGLGDVYQQDTDRALDSLAFPKK